MPKESNPIPEFFNNIIKPENRNKQRTERIKELQGELSRLNAEDVKVKQRHREELAEIVRRRDKIFTEMANLRKN